MSDQANELRQLVQRAAVPAPAPDWAAPRTAIAPRVIVVGGGKGGVGTTTIAVNLALTLQRRGANAMLIDSAPGGDAAVLCHLEPRYTIADVLSGKQPLAATLHRTSGNLRILAGVRGLERLSDFSLAAFDAMLGRLVDLQPQPQFVVVDAGNVPGRIAELLWQMADCVLVVTSPEPAAIMDTYAAIKRQTQPDRGSRRTILVNRAPISEVADRAFERLDSACRRFLGMRLASGGYVPLDDRAIEAAARGEPLVATWPGAAASRHLNRIAQLVMTGTEKGLSRAA